MEAYIEKYITAHLEARSTIEKWCEYLDSNIDSQFVNLIACNDTKILYVGCGTGGFFHFFNKAKLIYAVDTNKGMLDVAKNPPNADLLNKNLQIIVNSEIPTDIKFDIIFYSPFSTYEVITNDRLVQLADMLHSDGKLVVHFPNRYNVKGFFNSMVEVVKLSIKTVLNFLLRDKYFLKFDIRVYGASDLLSKRVKRVANLKFSYLVKNNNLLCMVFDKKLQ